MAADSISLDPSIESFSLLKEWFKKALPTLEMELVLEELFVNIVYYAYTGKSQKSPIEIAYLHTEEGLQLTFTDRGIPFDPTLYKIDETLDETGHCGLFLVRKITSSLSYARKGELNIVTAFIKNRQKK